MEKQTTGLTQIRVLPLQHLLSLTRHNHRKLSLRHLRLRYLQRFLHSLPRENQTIPFSNRRPIIEIETQNVRRRPYPTKTGNICDCELLARDIGRFPKTCVQDHVESFGFVDIALDTPVGTDRSEASKVVGLAYFRVLMVIIDFIFIFP